MGSGLTFRHHDEGHKLAHPEANLISAVLRGRDMMPLFDQGVDDSFFHVHRAEAKFLFRYYDKHKAVPSKDAFKRHYPEFRIKAVDEVDFWAEEVRTSHVKQNLTNRLNDMIENLSVGDFDSVVKEMHATALASELTLSGTAGQSFDIFSSYDDIATEIERRHDAVAQGGYAGIPTGFPTLDEVTGGLQPGWLTIIGARLGSGKTSTMIKMATTAAFNGHTVQFNALEQTRAEIAMRVHAYASSQYSKGEFKAADLAKGQNFSPRAYRDFLIELATKVSGKFNVIDVRQGALTPLTLAAQIERNKPSWVGVDYFGLMEAVGGSKVGDDDWRGLANLSKKITQIAKQYQVPIVMAAQLNRAAGGNQRRGNLTPEAIADTDNLGRDADLILLQERRSERVMHMRVAKFRHGSDGQQFFTAFEPNIGKFIEIDGDKARDLIDEDERTERDGSSRQRTATLSESLKSRKSGTKRLVKKG